MEWLSSTYKLEDFNTSRSLITLEKLAVYDTRLANQGVHSANGINQNRDPDNQKRVDGPSRMSTETVLTHTGECQIITPDVHLQCGREI
jgi:hypothetical protein